MDCCNYDWQPHKLLQYEMIKQYANGNYAQYLTINPLLKFLGKTKSI